MVNFLSTVNDLLLQVCVLKVQERSSYNTKMKTK